MVSSRSSSNQVYQEFFVPEYCGVWDARSALARNPPCSQLWPANAPLGGAFSAFRLPPPPRQARPCCTSGEPVRGRTRAQTRANGAPNRPRWLQLLHLRASGTIRLAVFAQPSPFRRRRRRGHAPPPPERPFRQFRGGGYHRYTLRMCTFWDPNAGAANFCSTASTYGHKIFFAQTVVSSRSSSNQVYQGFFCF